MSISIIREGVITKVYKIQRYGNSYYICIPKIALSKKMIDKGVVINIVEKSDDRVVLSLECIGEHIKGAEKR
ncbi:MAG: hypothetical protein NC827_05905 [Candidatus Omnitrophica bacterium]|nr:hypothetical protein [Candidatus Omnitrophota bacterium]